MTTDFQIGNGAVSKAATLIEALPWLERFHGRTVVLPVTIDNVNADLTADLREALPSTITHFGEDHHFPGIRLVAREHGHRRMRTHNRREPASTRHSCIPFRNGARARGAGLERFPVQLLSSLGSWLPEAPTTARMTA